MNEKNIIFVVVKTANKVNEELNATNPSIIQIDGLVSNLINPQVIDTFSSKVFLEEGNYDNSFLEKGGYSVEGWRNAPHSHIVAAKLAAFVKKYSSLERVSTRSNHKFKTALLGGHNVNKWATPILLNWFKAQSRALRTNLFSHIWYTPYVCTLNMAMVLHSLGGVFKSSYSLQALCDEYNVKKVSDIQATYDLWVVLRERLSNLSKGLDSPFIEGGK